MTDTNTQSELERAVREAWPGCEVKTWQRHPNSVRVSLAGSGLWAAVCGPYGSHVETEAWFDRGPDERSFGYANHPDPATAIAKAKEQARARLREWLEAV